MNEHDTRTAAHDALTLIADLLERGAPIAARSLPDDNVEARQVFEALRRTGLKVAAEARRALVLVDAMDLGHD